MKLVFNIQRNVSAAVVAFAINIALIFATYRLVLNHGGVEALGLWAMLSAVVHFVRVGDLGMGSAAERHISAIDASAEPSRARAYLEVALLVNLMPIALLGTIGWLTINDQMEWIVAGDAAAKIQGQSVLPIMILAVVASSVSNVMAGGLRGLHHGYIVAYLSIAGAVLNLVIVCVVVPDFGITGLALAQLVQNCCLAISSWLLFARFISRPNVAPCPRGVTHLRSSILRALLTFSLKAQLVNFLNGAFEPLSKMLVGNLSGLGILGLYEVAYKIVALPRNAVVAGVLGLTPAMTRLHVIKNPDLGSLFRRSKTIVSFAICSLSTLLIIASPVASVIFMGEIDIRLVAFIILISLGFLVNTLSAPAYALGFSTGRLKPNLVAASLSVLILVLLGPTLGWLWPTYGVPISAAVSLGVGGIYILRNSRELID